VLAIQRKPAAAHRYASAHGNQAMLQLLASSGAAAGTLQRMCSCSGMGSDCADCKKKEGDALQRSPAAGAKSSSRVPPIVHDVLRSPGRPLDHGARAFMEPRFGRDFGDVRIHTDAKAATSADAVRALAYTVGNRIVFAADKFNLSGNDGKKLLAHELSHVVQQTGIHSHAHRAAFGRSPAGVSGPLTIGAAHSSAEREADAAADAIQNGSVNVHLSQQTPGIARQAAAPPAATEEKTTEPTGTTAFTSSSACTPGAGIPNSNCSAYAANAYWLPTAYVNNATCACTATPNVPTANCVRKFLQARLAATPTSLKIAATAAKATLIDPVAYTAFVQAMLTPRIYADHQDAYRACCCPYGPAPYVDWIGVTTIPFQPCSLVGWFINNFGSCTGTPGSW